MDFKASHFYALDDLFRQQTRAAAEAQEAFIKREMERLGLTEADIKSGRWRLYITANCEYFDHSFNHSGWELRYEPLETDKVIDEPSSGGPQRAERRKLA